MSNTFLRIAAVMCLAGIAGILGFVWLTGDSPDDTPVPIVVAPASAPAGSAEANGSASPQPTDEVATASAGPATVDLQSSDFRIEELTAECDAGAGFGVTALPLGANWSTTERAVYSNSPVLITCEMAGSTVGLAFEWSANYGEIQGSGDSITWVAPDHGAKAEVAVVVQNAAGDARSAVLHFRVATCDCIFERYQ